MLKHDFDWSVVTRGQYAEWIVSGLQLTLELSLVSMLLAFVLGLVLAVMRLSHHRLPRALAAAWIEFFRNTPLLIQIFFWYFGAPEVLPRPVTDWLNRGNVEFGAAVIALTIYTSAFIAEDIRSGVRSIHPGQMEAALASGFGYMGAMRHVILPQAIRITVPPLISQFLNLAKNSSLAMTIGVAELTYQARQVESYTFRSFEAFAAATLLYLALSLVITALVTWYERAVLKPEGLLR